MSKEEFIEKCKELENLGYQKTFKIGDPISPRGESYLFKVIERAEDEYGHDRAINILQLKVWSLEDFADRVDESYLFSFEPVVTISRDVDERMDFHIHHPKYDIQYLEQKAKEFGDWCKEHFDYKSSN